VRAVRCKRPWVPNTFARAATRSFPIPAARPRTVRRAAGGRASRRARPRRSRGLRAARAFRRVL